MSRQGHKILESLDPRMNRLDLQPESAPPSVEAQDYWASFEVFHQSKRGKRHEHVGTVHAPDHDMALVFAKEQFGRRQTCVNMWVVKTSDIVAFNYDDEDMFATNSEKLYREAAGFMIRDRIEKFKKSRKEEGTEISNKA